MGEERIKVVLNLGREEWEVAWTAIQPILARLGIKYVMMVGIDPAEGSEVKPARLLWLEEVAECPPELWDKLERLKAGRNWQSLNRHLSFHKAQLEPFPLLPHQRHLLDKVMYEAEKEWWDKQVQGLNPEDTLSRPLFPLGREPSLKEAVALVRAAEPLLHHTQEYKGKRPRHKPTEMQSFLDKKLGKGRRSRRP